MSDKFKYAPGKPGFGSKGDDGSVGAQGLAMYFTDLDPNAGGDSFILNDKIRNNYVLWQSSSDPLPGGRTYIVGDLFFDSEGKTYEITNTTTGAYEYKLASLNMGGFFVPLEINTDNGFQRYFNSNLSPKYIIDNVYTAGVAINYTESPLNIYGIEPKNFARIEYTNVVYTIGPNQYNPFTVYSSAEAAGLDDQKSIAIVRDNVHNSFRIGNLDDIGNIRNVNLIFDVSSLIHTKQLGNYFSANTPVGSILTNYEINANSLFSPNFNEDPLSFVTNFYTPSKDASISWVLSDFTNDPGVTGTLEFFTAKGPYNGASFRFDSSAMRPLIFNNVDPVGSVRITGLNTTDEYICRMKLTKNGWSRTSIVRSLFGSTLAVTPISYIDVSAAESSVGFNIITNVAWDVSLYNNPGGFMSIESCPSGGNPSHVYDGSLYIKMTSNLLSNSSRTGHIKISNVKGGTSQNVSVTQIWGIKPPDTPIMVESFTKQFPQQLRPWPGSKSTYSTNTGKSSYVWTVTNGVITSGAGTNTIDVSWNAGPPYKYTGVISVNYMDGAIPSYTTTNNYPVYHQLYMTPAGGNPMFFSETTGLPCAGNVMTVYATGLGGLNPNKWYASADVPISESWFHLAGYYERYPQTGKIPGIGSAQTFTVTISAGHGPDMATLTVYPDIAEMLSSSTNLVVVNSNC